MESTRPVWWYSVIGLCHGYGKLLDCGGVLQNGEDGEPGSPVLGINRAQGVCTLECLATGDSLLKQPTASGGWRILSAGNVTEIRKVASVLQVSDATNSVFSLC